MVDRNDFELVSDGDTLSEGYFNDIYSEIQENNNLLAESLLGSFAGSVGVKNGEYDDFQTNSGSVITNLSYRDVGPWQFAGNQVFDNARDNGFYYKETGTTGEYIGSSLLVQTTNNRVLSRVSYNIYNIVDDFEDNSISGDWTTSVTGTGGGTISESGGGLRFDQMSNTNNGLAYYTGKNYYLSGSEVRFLFYIVRGGGSASGSLQHNIILHDGSSLINLLSATVINEQGYNEYHDVRIAFYDNQEVADIYLNDELVESKKDLSSLSTNWYIGMNVICSSSNISINQVMFWLLDSDISSPSSTVTQDVSVDGGNTFSGSPLEGTSNKFQLPSSGNNIVQKINVDRASGEFIILNNRGIKILE